MGIPLGNPVHLLQIRDSISGAASKFPATFFPFLCDRSISNTSPESTIKYLALLLARVVGRKNRGWGENVSPEIA